MKTIIHKYLQKNEKTLLKKKKMLEYITDDLEISSDDADKNNSFEESSIPQNIRNYCFSDSASSLLKYKKFLKNI